MSELCSFDIRYDWGHKSEMANTLTQMDNSKTQKPLKYPLVWLIMDFKEKKGKNWDVYSALGINFLFAVDTHVNYTQPQRRDKSYLPKLLPMYGAFMQAISEQTAFMKPYIFGIEHDFLLRPYWGDGVNANLFNDFIDAIEISNLNLEVAQKKCTTPAKLSLK